MPVSDLKYHTSYFLIFDFRSRALRDFLCFENRVAKVKNVSVEAGIVQGTTTAG